MEPSNFTIEEYIKYSSLPESVKAKLDDFVDRYNELLADNERIMEELYEQGEELRKYKKFSYGVYTILNEYTRATEIKWEINTLIDSLGIEL